jgi:hypothetical protein
MPPVLYKRVGQLSNGQLQDRERTHVPVLVLKNLLVT